jgi:glucokinase
MAGCVLGADAGGSSVKWVVRGAGGGSDPSGEVPTNPSDPIDTLTRLAQTVRAHLADSCADPASGGAPALTAVGLACAGIVSDATGRLGRSPNLPGWQNQDLGAHLRAAFGEVPAVLANDVNAALYGEWRLGAGQGARDAVMIALGTGVGGGVVCGGRLVTGARNAAGEIGHTVLDLDGPLCACGNHGCLEAYAGTVALRRRARELAAGAEGVSARFRDVVATMGDRLDAGMLQRLADAGDTTAASLFAEAGRRLGQAVANCVDILDPDIVIIGGGIALAGDLIFAPCRATARSLIMARESRDVPIVPAQLGPFAASLGVAELAHERLEGAA